MIPSPRVIALCAAAILSCPRGRAADSATVGSAAALLAVSPRTNLPPQADDPMRPRNTRLLKANAWVDDAGVDDLGNVYNRYSRSAFGTWSNYDPALANPYPVLPDPLILKDGRPVRDAQTWWGQRRPEILGDFFAEVYGRIPSGTPRVTWEVTGVKVEGAVRTKTIVGHIDNSAFPDAAPQIRITLSLPVDAAGPVPVMVVVAGGGGPPRARAAAAGAPAPSPAPTPVAAHGMTGPSPREQVLARGWGFAVFNTSSVQQDSASGLTGGIIGLVNKGAPRTSPDQWGTLSAWAWGLSRTIDYFETDRDVDAKRLGVEGHSRWGKTALWAAATDPRWAIVYSSCSGEGGTKLFRRNYGETTDNIAGSSWMAENFHKYGGHWNDLPVDSHELIALVAPRPILITGGTQDPWSDPRGEFMAAVAAGPVYRLLGANDLGTTEMPAPDVALVAGEVAFREHVGPHSDLPDWPVFLDFASRYFTRPAPRG